MQDAVEEIVNERRQGAMHMRMLAAAMAEFSGQRRAAIQAAGFMRMAVSRQLAGPGFDRPPQQASGNRITDRFEFAHSDPLSRLIRRSGGAGRGGMLAIHRMVRRIGLLGGSFNPAHRAHRAMSLAAIEALGLDEVWWLVSPGNPLKDKAKDMAPFVARLASARAMARRSRIKVSDFESREGTRYTADTISLLLRRWPKHRFIWLMGEDTVAQFHQWKHWRALTRMVPIAVISRPGYDDDARAARAMGWLRRFVRPASQARNWTEWSAPAIIFLRLPPDRTSATRLRALNPDWHRRFIKKQSRAVHP